MKYIITLVALASTAFALQVPTQAHDPALAEIVARTGETARNLGGSGTKADTGKKNGTGNNTGKKNSTTPSNGGNTGGKKNSTTPSTGGGKGGAGGGSKTNSTNPPAATTGLPAKGAAGPGKMAALSNAGGYVSIAALGVAFAVYA